MLLTVNFFTVSSTVGNNYLFIQHCRFMLWLQLELSEQLPCNETTIGDFSYGRDDGYS